MCEWILELELLKIHLRILSEWFAKHLEISLRETSRGFESLPLRQNRKRRIRVSSSLFYTFSRFCRQRLIASMTAA